MNQAGRALRHINMFSYVFWEKWVILSCPLNSTGAGWNAWNTPMPFCDMLRMKMMKSEGPGAFFAGAIPRCVQDWWWVGTSHSRFNILPWQTGQKSKHACQWTAMNSCLNPTHLTWSSLYAFDFLYLTFAVILQTLLVGSGFPVGSFSQFLGVVVSMS